MASIIVVEDDLGQQEELVSFLGHAGHRVVGAANGAEMAYCLQHLKPDVVLLDYGLPGESGASLIAHLRKSLGKSVGVVMVTARSQGADRTECRRAGADDYLVKPVDFEELLALIDNLTARLTPSDTANQIPWQIIMSQSRLISPNSSAIELTTWEVMLLVAIANSENQIADRDVLMQAIGKSPATYDIRALEAVISRLRRKLPIDSEGSNPLKSVRNTGYKFVQPLVVFR